MTATAKIPEALPVDTPASTVQSKLPDDNLATITVEKEKFYDLKGREVRKKALELMGKSMELLSPQKNLKLWFNGRC
jgi:biopolymer transport protein ExbD